LTLAEVTTNSPDGEKDLVALAPGKMIGRYEIQSTLGQGGFGITYRARDEQLHREVAIKEYLPSALAIRQDGATVLPRSTKAAEDFAWGRQRFVDEGRTLATLQRAPAIVRVFDFLEANGTAYIVMELVPGHTLEERLKSGPLTPAEIDRILWPLLDGLEQVHATGFLHRDIKPANILLDDNGNPTLIDFGASRAAMAGRSQVMTAIFTPGYAAAEQMTAAKQGPWSDIYGLSATLYHAITGAAPPSAFDRMLDDEYQPLGQLQPSGVLGGFLPGLLVGLDAGLAVRASDRPQSIAGWRPILGQASMADAQATMAMTRSADANATIMVRQPTITPPVSPTITPAPAPAEPPSPRESRRTRRRWVGAAVLLIFALAGGYRYATRPPAVDVAAQAKAAADAKAQVAAAAKLKQDEDELARFRAEQARRDQQVHDEQAKRQAAEERQKQLVEEAAQRRALESDKARAAEDENALHLSLPDRQHVQVALKALGFDTNGTDGVFSQRTREMIAAWQRSRSYPDTGYLTGAQSQELPRAAAAAVTKFDDDQKKAEDERKKADEAKAKAAVAPPVASASGDGVWSGSYKCAANNLVGSFTLPVHVTVQGGHGLQIIPNAVPSSGSRSFEVFVNGKDVTLRRATGVNTSQLLVNMLAARLDGGAIIGQGIESASKRTCHVILTRG
jgi:serine/threonine protein kinase/peptidoglycan hydrolase-like protein with peptidoglycan-binding domain